MADFENRETNFNKSLGGTIAGFASAIVAADSAAKDAQVDRISTLLDKPNVQFSTSTSLIGSDQKLATVMDVPRIAVTRINPVEIEKATLKMSMSVSAHQETSSSSSKKAKTSGSLKVGWGPVSFGVSFSAEVSVQSSSKRSSDYRATTDAEMTMVQGAPPEALQSIMDTMNETVRVGLELNKGLMQHQAQALADESGVTPAPDDDEGGEGEE